MDRLGSVARTGAGATLSPGVRALQMARLVGFWDGRARRHRLSLDGCVVLDARPWLSIAHRGGIDKAVQRDGASLLTHHVRVPRKRQPTRGDRRVARR